MPSTTCPPFSIPVPSSLLWALSTSLGRTRCALIGLARTKYFPCIMKVVHGRVDTDTTIQTWHHTQLEVPAISSVDFHREGVQPLLSRALTSAPYFSSNRTVWTSPPRTAACSAVEPKTLRASITAPRLSSIQANAVCPWNTLHGTVESIILVSRIDICTKIEADTAQRRVFRSTKLHAVGSRHICSGCVRMRHVFLITAKCWHVPLTPQHASVSFLSRPWHLRVLPDTQQ